MPTFLLKADDSEQFIDWFTHLCRASQPDELKEFDSRPSFDIASRPVPTSPRNALSHTQSTSTTARISPRSPQSGSPLGTPAGNVSVPNPESPPTKEKGTSKLKLHLKGIVHPHNNNNHHVHANSTSAGNVGHVPSDQSQPSGDEMGLEVNKENIEERLKAMKSVKKFLGIFFIHFFFPVEN